MMWSGVLRRDQVYDIYDFLSKESGLMRMGTIAGSKHFWNNQFWPFISYGLGYGLLQHDFVERFLLHFFANSAHSYTRGTWTAPESTNIDREAASVSYAAAAQPLAPIYLKWALVFEDPETRSLWLGKALPRVWLEDGEAVTMSGVPTRYGRISAHWKSMLHVTGEVRMNISLPSSFAFPYGPPGGVRLRVRAPASFAGGMKSVTVGGRPWSSFDATAETVDFDAKDLTSSTIQELSTVVATFSNEVITV